MSIDVMDRLAAANPVPDGATKPEAIMSATALRDVIDDRRGIMQTHDIDKVATTEPPAPRRRGIVVAAAAFGAVVAVGIGIALIANTGNNQEPDVGNTPQAAGPVRIETDVEFDAQLRPIRGTFEVTEGADILGCSTGTFVDAPQDTSRVFEISMEFACETGTSEGTFTALVDDADPSSGALIGLWSIVESTGDFAALQGGGDFSLNIDQGVATLTGDIEYTS